MKPAKTAAGESLCHETGPGGFYRSAVPAIADTKKAGWHLVKGEWVCPACWKIEK
jgi:hypothetical protein